MNRFSDEKNLKNVCEINVNGKSSKTKSVIRKKGFWIFILFAAIIFLSSGSTVFRENGLLKKYFFHKKAENVFEKEKNDGFYGDCGIYAEAKMGKSAVGYPEITIFITNKSDKDISEIYFYAVPCDEKGEKIEGWTRQKNLYSDILINSGKSSCITYNFIEERVKTVNLYVYKVCFSDGSKWGDSYALEADILENSKEIKVLEGSLQ